MLSKDELKQNFNNYKSKIIENNNAGRDLVLNTHLIIEQKISQLLEHSTRHLKVNIFKSKRSNFYENLKVSLAIGLIDEEIFRKISELNRIRNLFAHDLNYKISQKDIKSVSYKYVKQGSDTETLSVMLFYLLGRVDVCLSLNEKYPFYTLLLNKYELFKDESNIRKLNILEYQSIVKDEIEIYLDSVHKPEP